ncbi:MAG TPA: cytochrome P460 family protein [Polyangiaceae bacterium]
MAFERDFQDFRDWTEVPVPKLEAQGVTHTEGDVRQWINARPAPGATSFPVGTMIVKEVTNEAKKTYQVFAMVKRGGDYNRLGAPGWEWFELRERPDESLAISWRGINAPDGESYAGDPLGGCNSCHQLAAKNDYVKSATLALAPPGKIARH